MNGDSSREVRGGSLPGWKGTDDGQLDERTGRRMIELIQGGSVFIVLYGTVYVRWGLWGMLVID